MNLHLAIATRYRCFLPLILAFAMLQLLVGCSDRRGERVPVSGTITIDGKPLKLGSIMFKPIATPDAATQAITRAGSASLGEDGRFSVSSYTPNDGLLLGKYEVVVSAVEPLGDTAQRRHAPRKYSNTNTSGLTLDVSEAMEDVTFKLSWEGEKHTKPWVEKF